MNIDKIASIAAALVVVAGVTTVVSHPASASVIRAVGDAFTGSLRAAQGK